MKSEEAYFEFCDVDEKYRFVVKLLDPKKIATARAILAGKETSRVHVQGTIIPRKAPYNPAWNYHLKPESIEFFFMAIEVCDSTMRYVEEHLGEVGGSFLPNAHWCPWASRLTRELPISKAPSVRRRRRK